MPGFVAGFAAFFSGATVVGVTGTLGFLAATAVFNAALGAIARKFTSKKESDTGRSQPREVTVRATDAYDVYVYGRALVGGVTVYNNGIPDSNGVNNRMHHVVKWAGHECTSISLFKFDDRRLNPEFSTVDWDPVAYTGTGLVETGEFRGATTASGPTYMRWYLGNQTSADARLVSQADEWTTAHIGQGQTYGVLEIWQVDEQDQTSKVFQKSGGRGPNNVAAHIHGKKVYDHRRYALNGEPRFGSISSHWFGANGATTVSGDLAASSDNWSRVQGIGGTHDSGIANSSAVLRRVYSDLIPVDPTSTYSIRLDARDINASSRALRANVLGFMDTGVGISAQAWVNTRLTANWAEFTGTVASGGTVTLSDSARFIRIGLEVSSGTGGTMHLQAQDYAVYLGTGSRHLLTNSATWEYSESPPFCVADYLIDERLGFGKRLRVPVNPSRYARNGDPTWRRENTLSTHWLNSPSSGQGGALNSSLFTLSSTVAGAPVGRRALVAVSTDITGGFYSDRVPIDPSGQYFISIHARQDGDKGAQLGVFYQDGNGLNIAGADLLHASGALPSIWSNFTINVGSGTGNAIPSSARFISIGGTACQSFGTNTLTQQYFQDYRLMVGTQDRHFIEPHEQIFWPSVSSAAAYTDAIVATPSGDQVRFACNGAGHTGAGHRSNIRDLLSSFNGRCVYVQSGFHISAGWEEPTKTLNKSDFRKGGMKIRAKAELLDRYNHVRGTFYDPDNEFKRVPTATVTAPEYVARDSSQQLFHDVFLPFTNDWFMAQRVEFGILEQGDNQQLVEFQLKHSALDLMPGKVVGINHDVVSWQNHTLRMVDMETDLKEGVKLFGREDYEASYVDVGTSEYFSRQFNGVTSSAPIVPQVSSVSLTPRDGGIQLNWRNPAARSFEYIDVYRRTTNAFSGSTLIKSTRNDEHFDPLQPGQTQYYWFRTRDFANNVSSVYPGLTSSFSAAGLFPVARDPEYVEEFRYQSLAEFQQKWEHKSGSGDVTFVNLGTIGGKVLQSSGFTWWTSRIRIPYDPDALYQMTVKVRQTSSVDANRDFWSGFIGYRADGSTIISVTSGSNFTGTHNFVRNNQTLNSLDLWVEYTGHMRGHMPWPLSGTVNANLSQDPKLAARMHDLVRYVSPHFILNENDGGGTAQIDYISVRKLTPYRTVTFDPEITAQSNWFWAVGVNYLGPLVGSDTVQSMTNVNVAGEYSVLPLTLPFSRGVIAAPYIAERYRPNFHPRMPSSGAYGVNLRVRVTSFNTVGKVIFRPRLIAYTRTGSAVFAFGTDFGAVDVAVGSTGSATDLRSNVWHDIGGTITISSDAALNQNSGPYFVAPAVQYATTGAVPETVLDSSWIAYLNITGGNP